MKLRNLILGLLVLLSLSSCHKRVQKKEIAVLVPYSYMTQIWHSFVDAAKEEFSDTLRYNLHFYQTANYVADVFAARSYAHDSRPIVERTLLKRIKSEGLKPDLIITYGDYLSHAAASIDDTLLTETPVLCAGVVHPRWKDLLAARPNFVVMEAKPQVKENLDFIKAMGFPHYVVTVMDSTYIDDHIRYHILEQIGNDPDYRPNLYLEEVDRIQSPNKRDSRITLLPVSIMYPEKNDRHPDVQGAFELDWIFFTQQQGTSFLNIKEDAYSNSAMSYNIGPYFTMTPEYFNLPLINAMNTCIGGYFTPYPSMWKQVHPIVDKLLSGTPPKMIPWGVLEKDYWLDWRLVKNIHPYASDFPKGVKFVNLPWRQRSRVMYWSLPVLISILVVLFIICAVIIPSVMYVRQKRQRRLLFEKAKEADRSEKQVEYILSEMDSYMWQMLPDGTMKFSPSFYRDFGLPEDYILDNESILKYIHEPGRSKLNELALSADFDGEVDMEVMVDIPGSAAARAILVHTISLTRMRAQANPDIPLKAGLFYFNDEVHNRNEELRQAYRRSEEVAEKESFLASMSTKFKEPLDRIVRSSRILARKFNELDDEQKEEYGQQVMDANDRLIGLLDEVMGDTRQMTGDDSGMSRKNLSALMEEIYTNHSVGTSGESAFDFKPGPQESEIMVSRPSFLQIMDTLVNDALTAGHEGVVIGWTQEPEKDVVIFIENSGTDISRCSQLVESMGGRINMHESPDGRHRIEIVFPFTPPIRKWAEEL